MFGKPKRNRVCGCKQCPGCISATVALETQPYNALAWRGRHPLNPAPRR
jgi:hypothetical protein